VPRKRLYPQHFRRLSGNCYRRTIRGREALTEHRHTITKWDHTRSRSLWRSSTPAEPGPLNLQLHLKIEAQVSRRFALITTTPGKHAHHTPSPHTGLPIHETGRTLTARSQCRPMLSKQVIHVIFRPRERVNMHRVSSTATLTDESGGLQGLKDRFRAAMGNVSTPVSVVTSFDGRPHGTTVSAFASLSMEPPMVMVALDRSSNLLEVIQRTHRFALNVLAHGQADVGLKFAVKGPDKFTGIDWQLSQELPRIAGTAGWVACEVESFVSGGDHVVLLGHVKAAGHNPLDSLTYHRGAFGTHVPTPRD